MAPKKPKNVLTWNVDPAMLEGGALYAKKAEGFEDPKEAAAAAYEDEEYKGSGGTYPRDGKSFFILEHGEKLRELFDEAAGIEDKEDPAITAYNDELDRLNDIYFEQLTGWDHDYYDEMHNLEKAAYLEKKKSAPKKSTAKNAPKPVVSKSKSAPKKSAAKDAPKPVVSKSKSTPKTINKDAPKPDPKKPPVKNAPKPAVKDVEKSPTEEPPRRILRKRSRVQYKKLEKVDYGLKKGEYTDSEESEESSEEGE